MTEIFIRNAAAGAGDGSSYANAYGITDTAARTLLDTVSGDTFWFCDEFAATQASANTYRFSVASGLSRRRPKIIRLDYPGHPGIIWGGYLSTATWTETATDSQIWTATMLSSAYDDENACAYAIFFNGAERRDLIRTETSGDCDSTPDTFYVTGSTCRIHLSGADEDPNGNKIMLAQYGHRILFRRTDAPMRHVHFHGGEWHPMARLSMTEASGAVNYMPRDCTWDGAVIEHGAGQIFPLYRTRGITVRNSRIGKVSSKGAFYVYIPTYDDQGNTLGAHDARRPRYNNTNLVIENTKLHTAGVWSRGDSHLIGLQALHHGRFIGIDMSWSPAAFVWWHSNESVAYSENIRVEHCGVDRIWSGEGANATTNKPLRAFATESGTDAAATFATRTMTRCWVGGIAGTGVEPLHPQIAYRLQANNPGHNFIVTNCVAVDTPCGIAKPTLAPYASYSGMTIVDPAGHSTHNVYATLTANEWTTCSITGGTLSGLTDEATMFAVAASETAALTTYLSKTNATNPAGSYRHFDGTAFETVLSPLSIDFGELSAEGVIVTEAA